MSTVNNMEGILHGWSECERLKSKALFGPPNWSCEKSDKEMYLILNSEAFHRQIRESDGFYVDLSICTQQLDIQNTLVSFDIDHKLAVRLTASAINTFNRRRHSFQDDTHGELKFVKLLNAIGHSGGGNLCYLTFEAMNLDNGNTYTYQATVFNQLPYLPNTVQAFRLKPAPGSTKTWFWEDPCCDDEETDSESGEGVSGDSEVIKVTAMFFINADVGYEIIDACLTRHIYVFTGAHYSLEETISYPGKKVIVLHGTPEQVQKASPMVLECIRKFQNYEVTGNEILH